jgi:hypothetical protein
MVSIGALWLPILLSAVTVWAVSAIIWMVLPHHKSDYAKFPDEEAARQALAPQNLAPGLYDIPHITSASDLNDPDVVQRFEQGPVGFFTVVPAGVPTMGSKIMLSVAFYFVISVVVAYLAGRTFAAGADYLAVFRISGTVAWLAYGTATVPDAIWFGRPWAGIAKGLLDALVYALLTAGFFAWLWPA